MSIKLSTVRYPDAIDISDSSFPLRVIENESYLSYKKRLLDGSFKIADFARFSDSKVYAPEHLVYHGRFLEHCSNCNRRPPSLEAVLQTTLVPEKYDMQAEIMFVADLIRSEEEVSSGLQMYLLLKSGSAKSSDYIYASSRFKSIKTSIQLAHDEMCGTSKEASTGIRCPACGKETATMRPEQIRAGDEPTSMRITCSNPMCTKKVHIVG